MIAKRLRDFGLLGLLLGVSRLLWAVFVVLLLFVIRLERRFLLSGLKMELESLEGGRTGASVIAVETDEEI